jgi:ferredoxin/flavodoxin---NADP+ reductase
MPERLQAAVIGAGPSGFYTAGALLKAEFDVDLYDALPTPYGLVRAGVAPDHPKLKAVTRVYDKIAAQEGFRFFGGVRVGEDVAHDELRERYHAIVYAVGTPRDNRLGIPGEDAVGSYSATDFVAWYNGHPEYAEHTFDLAAERAVVVGNGNVAIDVARMLVLPPDEVAVTDTADHAIEHLEACGVREVVLLGRRGPAQAAFTNPELLELGELTRADVVVDPAELELDPVSAEWLESDAAGATAKRNVDILRGYAEREPSGKSHRVVLRFLRSPAEILTGDDGRVCGLRVVHNRIEQAPDGRLAAVPTAEEETIPCGLVLRAIGYRGRPMPGLPFDERSGLLRNDGGRIVEDDGRVRPGEYAVGWIKRGPKGVIGTNKKDAADTVARIVEDAGAGRLAQPADADREATAAWVQSRVPDAVSWVGWEAIDVHERTAGEPLGRPRVKLVRIPEMLDVAGDRTGR